MINWGWAVFAFFFGGLVGIFGAALCMAAKDDYED